VEEVKKTLAELPMLDRPKLLDLWRANFGKAAPPGLRRELIVPILAYRIQERAYGGLKKETILKLRQLAREFDKKPSISTRTNEAKPGTRIVRQWRGQTHEVTAVGGGWLYRDVTYKSLSEIARLITGARWSGPLFFGLKRQATKDRRQQHV
jgi:hypothetical protein